MPEKIRKHRNYSIMLIYVQIFSCILSISLYFRRRVSHHNLISLESPHLVCNILIFRLQCGGPLRYHQSKHLLDVLACLLLLLHPGSLLRILDFGLLPEKRAIRYGLERIGKHGRQDHPLSSLTSVFSNFHYWMSQYVPIEHDYR